MLEQFEGGKRRDRERRLERESGTEGSVKEKERVRYIKGQEKSVTNCGSRGGEREHVKGEFEYWCQMSEEQRTRP